MSTFPPYEKIRDSLAACLGDDEPAFRAAIRVPWVVTEKIHGANFCFLTEGQSVRCAKRKSLLAADEDFFGHRTVLARLTLCVIEVFRRVRALPLGKSVETVLLYGEIFGGKYPHPAVPPVHGVLPVQTGVWYSPRIEFCAFDVGLVRSGKPERTYLDQDVARRLCEESGVRYARPLFRGSYGEAIAFPIGFETTLPARLGLPSLGPDNKAEGIVVKPERQIIIPQRDTCPRPVIKRKIPEFSEDKRFHGAEKWSAKPAPASHASLELLRQEASSLVNENRWNAAASKVGRIEARDKDRIADVLALVCEDVMSELKERLSKEMKMLSKDDARALQTFVEEEARALVELYLK